MNNADRKLLDKYEKRLEQVEEHIITFNHELGELCGKMSILIWLFGGMFLAVLGHWVYDVITKVN